jgi:hypothetical protein
LEGKTPFLWAGDWGMRKKGGDWWGNFMNLSRDVPGAGVIFRTIHLSIIMPVSMKADQSFTKNKNSLSERKKFMLPIKKHSL